MVVEAASQPYEQADEENGRHLDRVGIVYDLDLALREPEP